MANFCPECGSSALRHRVNRKHGGCGQLAPLAGAAIGSSGLAAGSSSGATLGVIGGPVGTVLGGLAGAIIGGVLAQTMGCSSNSDALVGSAHTDYIECADCGYVFRG